MSIIQWCQENNQLYMPMRHEAMAKISLLLHNHTHFEPETAIEEMYYGYYYEFIHDERKAEEYINRSIQMGNDYAHMFLINKLYKAGEFDKVEEYYLRINQFVMSSPIVSAYFANYKFQDTKHRDLIVAELYAEHSWARGCIYGKRILVNIQKYLFNEYHRVAIQCNNDLKAKLSNVYIIKITDKGYQYPTSVACLLNMITCMNKYATELQNNGQPEPVRMFTAFMSKHTTTLPTRPHSDQTPLAALI
jgi:tetratricopeptide (TPR) repeat protein